MLGSEEGIVLDTGEVLGFTLGAVENVKVELVDGTELGSLTGSLEGSNVGIPYGSFTCRITSKSFIWLL